MQQPGKSQPVLQPASHNTKQNKESLFLVACDRKCNPTPISTPQIIMGSNPNLFQLLLMAWTLCCLVAIEINTFIQAQERTGLSLKQKYC